MGFSTEDLDDQTRFRQVLKISYNNLMNFIWDHLVKKSAVMIFFWGACLVFLLLAIFFRIEISGNFTYWKILSHSFIGIVGFPLLAIPLHEFLHIVPYYLMGARDIRMGMDLKQYLFYVTAHRFVASPARFITVALIPFLVISIFALLLMLHVPWLWKWSISIFLFVHATCCAGDFSLINFYFLNRDKEIYTWDDVDKKEAYFYEKL